MQDKTVTLQQMLYYAAAAHAVAVRAVQDRDAEYKAAVQYARGVGQSLELGTQARHDEEVARVLYILAIEDERRALDAVNTIRRDMQAHSGAKVATDGT